ncbi:thiazole synthase [Streptomyces sp. NPDC048636]|uniref:thiazole synthase n=1 Tax=Streptomyces sp. NPDC048636 TaxID=3155762 RepID=UPI0034203596
MSADDPLIIDGVELTSRLMLGSTEDCDLDLLDKVLSASGAQLVTAAIRRKPPGSTSSSILDVFGRHAVRVIPNTSGCATAQEAVLTSQLAREATGANWVKLEITQDSRYLMPDPRELLTAAEKLAAEGFVVMPYMSDDPGLARRLEEVGCAALMPLGSPIGSGLGIANPRNIEMIVEQSSVPVIVDAGIGTASDAAQAMELGCACVATATAIVGAGNPLHMATAMRKAIEAGRLAHLAARIPKRREAVASSPLTGHAVLQRPQ